MYFWGDDFYMAISIGGPKAKHHTNSFTKGQVLKVADYSVVVGVWLSTQEATVLWLMLGGLVCSSGRSQNKMRTYELVVIVGLIMLE